MDFQVGDKVVHRVHGPGEVVLLEEKVLSGRKAFYYNIQLEASTIWVPVEAAGDSSLRLPTSAHEFERLFNILQGPGDLLPVDRLERKTYLLNTIRDGSLASICRVIRDLVLLRKTKKLSDYDAAILERSREFLLSEWTLALSIPAPQAAHELAHLLGEK